MASGITSPNGRNSLNVQDDGNLVQYHDGQPVWASDRFLPAPPPPLPNPVPGDGLALHLEGRFLYDGAQVYRWNGITAFALDALIAGGCEADARAWMLARRAEGFRAFRVLTMCSWLQLGPRTGLDALNTLLALARELGCALELVALSDTRAFGFSPVDCGVQVQNVCTLVSTTGYAGQALVQVANEHYHPTHVDWLHDVVNVDGLAFDDAVTITASAAANDEALEPDGEYITRHLDRGRDKWNMVRRVRELENVSRETGKYVINDEPMGAGEQESGSRYTDPAIAFTFGVLGRIFEVGSTFHCEAGLRCDPLGPVQQACATAFMHGATVIPEDLVLTFKNATWADSPVRAFDTTACVRVYSGLAGAQGWTCALGLTGDPKIEWQNGWRPVAVAARYPGVDLYYLERV